MYKNGIRYENGITDKGYPSSGWAKGLGFELSWNKGPLIDSSGNKLELNGVFPRDLLFILNERFKFLQSSEFHCAEYMEVLSHLECCLEILEEREILRKKRGVCGLEDI